jgi:predicted oxidoreductase (fatty acid repression mutant protein)
MVVLFDAQSDKLWDIVKEELKKIVPEKAFKKTEEKVDGSFKSGYGTILFFEDMAVVEGLQERFPLYKDGFAVWSDHSAGMHQFVIWTALSAEGLGASLQHYNPVIDNAVKKEWSIPDKWKLLAEMPFGKPVDVLAEKEVMPLEKRMKVYR